MSFYRVRAKNGLMSKSSFLKVFNLGVTVVSNMDVFLEKVQTARVAKCHGYGGYIRVKKLEGWGKKSGRIHSFAKSSIVLGKFEQLI